MSPRTRSRLHVPLGAQCLVVCQFSFNSARWVAVAPQQQQQGTSESDELGPWSNGAAAAAVDQVSPWK